MTVAVPFLIAAAAGMQAISAISQGQAQAASYKSAAAAADFNAGIQRQNADQARSEASAAEDMQRRRFRAVRANQEASIAESGIGIEGTGRDLIEQSNINGELDALNIRYEGTMKARGLLTGAMLSDYDAATARANAKNAKTSGYLSALGAVASGASSYAGYQQKYGSLNGTNNTGYVPQSSTVSASTGTGGLY